MASAAVSQPKNPTTTACRKRARSPYGVPGALGPRCRPGGQ